MYAYQWWADTTTGLLKIRNAANSAWVTIGTLASANLGLLPLAGGTMTGVLAVTAGTAALPGIAVSGDPNTGIYSPGADQIGIATGGTARITIDSSGRLLVGTSSYTGNSKFAILGGAGVDVALLDLRFGGSRPTGADSAICEIRFGSPDQTSNNAYANIACITDGASSSNTDLPARLVFSTTADGAASPTERARITSSGYFKASSTGSYQNSTGTFHDFVADAASGSSFNLINTNSSYAGALLNGGCDRAATTAYDFQNWYSAYSGTFDLEFRLRGDGNGFCDGSWTGGGADYAEYFEWSDGNPDEEDRRGISIVLDGEKIRPAVDGEDPIGVISGNPSVVGDAAWNKWSGKYLRDDYGGYILDAEGYRQLNPAYDPDQEYVNREDRPEWDCVGLMGKLRIRKGQPTGSRWIKMRDISDSVEEWLVR
jgi:hypothetical protein